MAKPDDHANTKKANIMPEKVAQDIFHRMKKRDQKINLSRQALVDTDSKIQTSATTATSLVKEHRDAITKSNTITNQSKIITKNSKKKKKDNNTNKGRNNSNNNRNKNNVTKELSRKKHKNNKE